MRIRGKDWQNAAQEFETSSEGKIAAILIGKRFYFRRRTSQKIMRLTFLTALQWNFLIDLFVFYIFFFALELAITHCRNTGIHSVSVKYARKKYMRRIDSEKLQKGYCKMN